MATAPYADPLFLTILLVLIMAAVFCISGLFQAGRYADKKIEITRASIQKRIDEFSNLHVLVQRIAQFVDAFLDAGSGDLDFLIRHSSGLE